MRVAVVGCGLIGNKRSQALGESRLVAVADVELARAQTLSAAHPGCVASGDWRSVVGRDDVDLVIVATTNDWLTPVALAAVERGKHVLVEKPAARSAAELKPLLDAARARGVGVKVGFNHRFHPAFLKARALVDEDAIGALMYIRARYGHGGRLGYEREWRADRAVAGGGELLDQGVHLIDLSRWFLGDFVEVEGHLATSFWKMSVEDNAFLYLRTAQAQTAWLHASCTEWKNLFSFEIFGRGGKLQIDGLGGSYGAERLTYHRMLAQMGPPETTVWDYPGEDSSWREEYRHLVSCIREGRPLSGSLEDALAALEVIGRVYERQST
jgi:predicted dehydrogenase